MIIHLDADAFYVSVEQAERPELRGKKVAVGGLHRGIIASASYEARACGVYTPMPTAKARQVCPDLILVRGDMQKYGEYSRRMFAFIEDFTPLIERTSIDEGYFDVSGHRTLSPREIAQRLKDRIRAELNLPVSFGIGENKLISQIAAKRKKPDALEEVPAGQASRYLAPLEVRWLPGIGAKAEARLHALGLRVISDVAEARPEVLFQAVGNAAAQLRAYALGLDERQVEVERDEAKSYGMQDTFGENIRDRETLLAILRTMADALMARVRHDGKAVRTVSIKVRYADFSDESHAETLDVPTNLETDLYPRLGSLLRGAWRKGEPLRLISLRLSNVCEPIFQSELTLDLDVQRRQKQRLATQVLDQLREKALPVMRGHGLALKARSV